MPPTKALAKLDTKDVTITAGRLDELETTVRDGQRTFILVGRALAEIRDTKGFKLRGFATFEDYCEKVHAISDRHGRRLIQATETAKTVSEVVGQVPVSESVAREFAPIVGDKKKIEKVAAALDRKGLSVVTATAEAIKEIVQKVNAKPAANGHAAPPAPVVPPEVEPLDLAFINKTLSRAEGFVRADAQLAADVHRALVQVRAELARQAGEGEACPECGKPVPAGAPFCVNCGAIL